MRVPDKTYLVYLYELFIIKSIKREVKTKPTYDCRCDERLEPKYDEFTCLTYTGLLEELDEFVYYESIKRGLKRRLIY